MLDRMAVCLLALAAASGCAARAPVRHAEPTLHVFSLEASDPALARVLGALSDRPTPSQHRAIAREYVRLGVQDKAHEHLHAAVALDPTDAAAWDGMARIWRDWGFPAKALPDAYRALYYAPQSPIVHNTLGTVLQALGRHAAARAQYERALALDGTAVYALTNLCRGAGLDGDAVNRAEECRQVQQERQP